MHDIVKAVGNCSYNQLVEKIISCKQSDNSELAGEGECFLSTCSTFWPARLPPPLVSSPHIHYTSGKFIMRRVYKADQCKLILHKRNEMKPGRTCGYLLNDLQYICGLQFSYQLSVTSPLKIFAHSTVSFLSSSLLGCCQVNIWRPHGDSLLSIVFLHLWHRNDWSKLLPMLPITASVQPLQMHCLILFSVSLLKL